MLFRLILLISLFLSSTYAANYVKPVPFSKHIQSKRVQNVSKSYYMPVITWADAMLAIDNKKLFPGGIKLVDDPIQQMNDVIAGKTPFIRQTVGSGVMINDALKIAGIEMIMFHSISDSLGGDVIVAKKNIKNLNSLKSMIKKGHKPVIAIQWGGPHMGWLVQLLDSLHIKISDVKIKYTKNLFGKNSPESAIAEDPSIDLAFVISPSAAVLTDGEYALENVHVLTSTKVMSDAIKDVLFVRKDWAEKNKQKLLNIRNAYLKSTHAITNNSLIKSAAFMLFGKGQQGIDDLIGMRDETRFHTKKRSDEFMYKKSNLMNYDRKTKSIIKAFANAKYISSSALKMKKYDWGVKLSDKAQVSSLSTKAQAKVINKVKALDTKGQGQDIFQKSIFFKPNQSKFSTKAYGQEFQEAIELAATYGGAVVKIVGNVDPQLQRAWNKAVEFKEHGQYKNLMKVQRYLKKVTGESYNFSNMSIQLIKTERNNIRNAAIQTSKERANAVKYALIKYAKAKNYNLDAARLVVLGVGGDNPIYEKPRNQKQFLKNVRVEFVITNYNSEISEFNEAQDF